MNGIRLWKKVGYILEESLNHENQIWNGKAEDSSIDAG